MFTKTQHYIKGIETSDDVVLYEIFEDYFIDVLKLTSEHNPDETLAKRIFNRALTHLYSRIHSNNMFEIHREFSAYFLDLCQQILIEESLFV